MSTLCNICIYINYGRKRKVSDKLDQIGNDVNEDLGSIYGIENGEKEGERGESIL